MKPNGPKIKPVMGILEKTFRFIKRLKRAQVLPKDQSSLPFEKSYQTITFSNGHRAQLFNVSPEADPKTTVLKKFALGSSEGLIMVSGDTQNLDESVQQRLKQLLSRGLAKTAIHLNAVLMDNGKTSGLVTLMGQSVADRKHKVPLIGVAATPQVSYPGQTEEGTTAAETTPLDPNHTHFVLVDTEDNDQAMDFRYRLGAALTPHQPAVLLLVNGGAEARAEVLQAVRSGWTIITVIGTGQLADEIADLAQNPPDFIQEPELAEIIADGKIIPFPLEGDLEELDRLIYSQFRGDNTLKLAWQQFALYDKNATRQQNWFYRLQYAILCCAVLGTTLALSQAYLDLQLQQAKTISVNRVIVEKVCEFKDMNQVMKTYKQNDKEVDDLCRDINGNQQGHNWTVSTSKKEKEALQQVLKIYDEANRVVQYLSKSEHEELAKRLGYFVVFLQWMIVAIPVILTVLIGISNLFSNGQKWIWLRSSAEALKSEIFRYRAKVGVYGIDLVRETKLADKIQCLNRHLVQSEVNFSALKPYHDSLPPPSSTAEKDDGFTPLSPERYLNLRLEDQLHYYQNKTAQLERQWSGLQWGILGLGGIGTLLAARGFELWIALTTGLVAALTSYLGYKQIEERLKKYNQASFSLTNILNWWSALSMTEKAKPENIERLVSDTETALGREFQEWTQQMQETVKGLKEENQKLEKEAQKTFPKEPASLGTQLPKDK
jgi:gas vesicle protein